MKRVTGENIRKVLSEQVGPGATLMPGMITCHYHSTYHNVTADLATR